MPNINLTCLTIYFCSELKDSCVSLCTTLNEKVGFKIPNTRYRNNYIVFGALHSGTANWTSGVGWTSGPLGVARGMKGSGTGLTFDPLRLLSDLIRKQKNPSRTNTQPENLKHIYTL